MIFKKLRDEPLPTFKYHPDPLGTGAIVPSDTRCKRCKKKRGYIYAGPVHSRHDLDHAICPWCIASGEAHKKFDAEFCDIGQAGCWGDVPEPIINEVATRTPGYTAWQDNQWWAHNGDAGAYLGMIGKQDLEALGPEAVAQWRANSGLDEWGDPDEVFDTIGPDTDITGYLFRCLHTGVYGGYIDAS